MDQKTIKSTMEAIKNMDEVYVNWGLLIILITILVSILIYYLYMRNLTDLECSMMNSLYQDSGNFIRSMDYNDKNCQYSLRDYYIMTAYNACSGGSYKNDFVDICPLKNVIKQGVRGLDFEIYSINDQPVVSTSNVENYNVKETYNYVPFNSVIDTITSNAFSSATAPNPTDPIILHLRIKSNNQTMLTNMAQIFKGIQNQYLLSPTYSNEFQSCDSANSNSQCVSRNLGEIKLQELNTKNGQIRPTIIVIVDRSNTAFLENRDFYEFVNMTSNSMFMRLLPYYDIKYTPDMGELQEYNKKSMTVSLPDNTVYPENPSGIVTREMGCQLLGVAYQQFDENIEENISFFNQAGYAFALKPEKLRYIPVYIEETPPNNPKLNFATRTMETDYYKFET